MIYEAIAEDEPIAQGDIFVHVPRVAVSLSDLTIIDEQEDARATSWREAVISGGTQAPVTALLSIQPVVAVVITQNCDALRGEFLSLCEIRDYINALNQQTPPANAKKWQSLIIETSRKNCRFFYLPESEKFGISGKKVVDFRLVIPIRREDLESMKDQRVGRLNAVATEHFRESIAHFFRRYALNEWYPLTAEEFEQYRNALAEPVEPYPWQKR